MHVSCSRRAGASSSSWGQGAEEWLKGAPAKRIPKAWPTRPRALPCPTQQAGSETTQVLQQQVGVGGGRETHSHPASWGQPPTPEDPLTLKGSPLFTHPEEGSVCPSPPSGTGAADSWGALNPHPGQAKGQKAGDRPEREGVVAQLLGLQPCTPTGASRGPGRGAKAGAPPGADTRALHPHGSQGRARAVGSPRSRHRSPASSRKPGEGEDGGAPRSRHRRSTEAPGPHLRQVHLGGQQSPGRAVGQRQVLRQEAPQLPRVPGHRVQREGGPWTGRRAGLKAGPAWGQRAPKGLRAELLATPTRGSGHQVSTGRGVGVGPAAGGTEPGFKPR